MLTCGACARQVGKSSIIKCYISNNFDDPIAVLMPLVVVPSLIVAKNVFSKNIF